MKRVMGIVFCLVGLLAACVVAPSAKDTEKEPKQPLTFPEILQRREQYPIDGSIASYLHNDFVTRVQDEGDCILIEAIERLPDHVIELPKLEDSLADEVLTQDTLAHAYSVKILKVINLNEQEFKEGDIIEIRLPVMGHMVKMEIGMRYLGLFRPDVTGYNIHPLFTYFVTPDDYVLANFGERKNEYYTGQTLDTLLSVIQDAVKGEWKEQMRPEIIFPDETKDS